MALEDIKMEKVPEEEMLKLPQIRAGDLVLVLAAKGAEWGERLLFCSDGKVAQTDVSVEAPYQVQRQIPLSEEKKEHSMVYAPRLFVDEAIRRGFLGDYVFVFGRDIERFGEEPTVGLEYGILYQAPIVFFGVDLNYAIGSLVKTGEFTSRTAGFFDTINPYEHGYLKGNRSCVASYPVGTVREVLVGEEAILSKLQKNPLEFILEKASLMRI